MSSVAVDAAVAPALQRAAAAQQRHPRRWQREIGRAAGAVTAIGRRGIAAIVPPPRLTDESISRRARILRAAAVQLTATPDTARNLETADRLVREAAERAPSSSCCRRSGASSAAARTCAPAPSRSTASRSRWARATARELGIDLVAGSVAERVPGEPKLRNTSRPRRAGRRGPRDVPQDPPLRRRGRGHRLPRVRARAARRRAGAQQAADGTELGLSICYDVRFPELYRVLAVEARGSSPSPAAFTVADDARPLGDPAARARDREPLLRHRRQPDRRARAGPSVRRALDDRRPLGARARAGPRRGDRDPRRPRHPPPRTTSAPPARAGRRRPAAYARLHERHA